MTATPTVVVLSVQRDPATLVGAGGPREDNRPSSRVERGIGGVQAHFTALRQGLERRGRDVAVVTSLDAPWPIIVVSAVLTKTLRRFDRTLAGWFDRRWHGLALSMAGRAAMAGRADGPVLFYPQCTTSTAVALRLRRPADRVTSVVHVFDDSEADEMAARGGCAPGDWFDRRIRAEERDVLTRADGLVFVSQMSHDSILAARPELEVMARRVIPNFLPDDWGEPRPPERRGGPHRLVTVGSIDERKNHAYALEIVETLTRSGHETHLDVIGDGPLRPNLEEAVAAKGLGDSVTIHGMLTDVRPLERSADMYLHTSTHEAFGIVLIEAMAMGLPVMAVPVGGIPSVFDDGVEGRYLPSGDAEAAARVIADLLDRPDVLGAMSDAASDRVERCFSASAVLPGLLSFMMDPRREAGAP